MALLRKALGRLRGMLQCLVEGVFGAVDQLVESVLEFVDDLVFGG